MIRGTCEKHENIILLETERKLEYSNKSWKVGSVKGVKFDRDL